MILKGETQVSYLAQFHRGEAGCLNENERWKVLHEQKRGGGGRGFIRSEEQCNDDTNNIQTK